MSEDAAKIVPDIIDGKNDPEANYSTASLLFHWLGALAVIVLFFTHEDSLVAIHVGLGMLLAIPLIARVWWRFTSGFARPPDQPMLLNLLARSVMLSLLACIVVLVVTGILLPATGRGDYDMFGLFSFRFQLGLGRPVHEFLEEAHDLAGHLILLLFGLHLLGFIKHRFLDKSGNPNRMLRPFKGGR